jgi:hypothetical protein
MSVATESSFYFHSAADTILSHLPVLDVLAVLDQLAFLDELSVLGLGDNNRENIVFEALMKIFGENFIKNNTSNIVLRSSKLCDDNYENSVRFVLMMKEELLKKKNSSSVFICN